MWNVFADRRDDMNLPTSSIDVGNSAQPLSRHRRGPGSPGSYLASDVYQSSLKRLLVGDRSARSNDRNGERTSRCLNGFFLRRRPRCAFPTGSIGQRGRRAKLRNFAQKKHCATPFCPGNCGPRDGYTAKCLPSGVTSSKRRDVLFQYIKSNPTIRHHHITILFDDAMEYFKAFGCKYSFEVVQCV